MVNDQLRGEVTVWVFRLVVNDQLRGEVTVWVFPVTPKAERLGGK